MIEDKIDSIVTNLKRFFEDANHSKAVLGLSGGVDSALTAKIAADALGPQNVSALIMPNEGLTDPQNVTDAEEWARDLGIQYFILPINSFLETYKSTAWEPSVMADMNLNARVRATLLYHFANTHDALVLGTGNKSELMLGYFTKYGDGACDVEVIGELYKTEVWEAAKALGIPDSIIQKAPSAELAPGQTDEGELGMSYAEADEILMKIEKGENPTGPAVDRVRELMKATEHKRTMPPSITYG